jgi:acyl dehydratase
MTDRFFEDFTEGEEFVSAAVTITESEIVQFRAAFDGRLSDACRGAGNGEDAGGGLRVSLPHLLAMSFRLFYDTGAIGAAGRASPGMDEIRYRKPVGAGDRVHVVARVLQLRPSASKPDRGTARIAFAMLDQDGKEVLTFTALQLLSRRP